MLKIIKYYKNHRFQDTFYLIIRVFYTEKTIIFIIFAKDFRRGRKSSPRFFDETGWNLKKEDNYD